MSAVLGVLVVQALTPLTALALKKTKARHIRNTQPRAAHDDADTLASFETLAS
ncbi:hypothetical protein [Paenarthrobacter aromaticivorans]|uniref:hypothetical protein n=1 Tax=Paenarthrobacter aromaticivorans TaxID=2849150 RepID=UPI001C247F7F|nr:hypothetical protein [Paenarthrobacter sp. MMS21-TAE1-1]